MTAAPYFKRQVTTPDEVARYWGCSPNHVRNLISRGELRAFRLGARLWRIPVEAIAEYELRQMTVVDERDL